MLYLCQHRFTQVQYNYIVYAQWKGPKIDPTQEQIGYSIHITFYIDRLNGCAALVTSQHPR